MKTGLLLLVPLVAAIAILVIPRSLYLWRRKLLPLAAAIHLAVLVANVLTGADEIPFCGEWLGADSAGLLFTGFTSVLFFMVSLYVPGDLRRYSPQDGSESGSERVYLACYLFFLFTMSLVCLSRDIGIVWVAVEATTLATAPLIYFRRNKGSLEATWKYLLICSVGIALALLGTFLLAFAAGETPDGGVTLNIAALTSMAPEMSVPWLRAAFIFILVGYGAKMGLAPMHTWLPDAHSEAPSPVSSLLSGALLNGAFLAIIRVMGIMYAAGQEEFTSDLLRLLGLFSMALAGAFILGQSDFKRLLAYSSVEHMGLMAFASGMGPVGLWVAFLHAANHTLTKGSLYLTAGNIYYHMHSKSVFTIKGLRAKMPYSGLLWLAGFMAICGLPPFGLFLSEFSALKVAFEQDRIVNAILYLIFLAVVFIGAMKAVLSMLRGPGDPAADSDDAEETAAKGESLWMAIPPLVLVILTLILGLGLPEQFGSLITGAVRDIHAGFGIIPGVKP